jgi:hypothetical protein
MNCLKRDLNVGEKLVLKNGDTVEVVAGAGILGAGAFTQGILLTVRHADGKVERIDAMLNINAEETVKQFSEVNGWSTPS